MVIRFGFICCYNYYLCQIEAHITWSGLTAGFEMFVGRVGQNLSSIEMTLLDNYSWASIVSIGDQYF